LVSTKDLVVIIVDIAVYSVTGLGGAAFAAFGGFAFFFPSTVWATIFPFWFGFPGVVGVALGNLFVDLYQGQGILALAVSGLQFVVSFLIWVLGPKRASEVKTSRDLASITGVNLVYTLAGFPLFPLIFYFAGFIPASAFLGVVIITILTTGPFIIIAVPTIMRAVTPYLKRTGYYYGNFREQREARKMLKAEGTKSSAAS